MPTKRKHHAVVLIVDTGKDFLTSIAEELQKSGYHKSEEYADKSEHDTDESVLFALENNNVHVLFVQNFDLAAMLIEINSNIAAVFLSGTLGSDVHQAGVTLFQDAIRHENIEQFFSTSNSGYLHNHMWNIISEKDLKVSSEHLGKQVISVVRKIKEIVPKLSPSANGSPPGNKPGKPAP